MNARTCPECAAAVLGRADKVHCSRRCSLRSWRRAQRATTGTWRVADPPAPVAVLLSAYATWGRSRGLREQSITGRCDVVWRFLREAGADPYTVDRAVMVGWLGREHLGTWSRATYRAALQSFWGFLHEFGHREDDPAARLRPIRVPVDVPKPVTDDELQLLLARSDAWWQLVIMLGAYAGLRRAEIAGLCREDVTSSEITVHGKGGKVARVPCHPLLWSRIRALPPGPLLHTPTGKPASGQWLSNRARRHFDRIGLPHVHLHRLRHWFGTTVQQRQGDIRVTQELMRHDNVASTQRYTAVDTAAKVAAIHALGVAA